MANLKEVRARIGSVTSTQQITKAMKMVAAAKLRKAQMAITNLRPYAQKLSSILSNVSQDDSVENVYAESREVNKVLIISVSSDKGLCGGFNTNVFKGIAAVIDEKYTAQQKAGNLTIMTIGSKGRDFFKRRDYNLIEDYVGILNGVSFSDVKPIAERIMKDFTDGTYDEVVVVYNQFKNVAVQIVQTEQFLPILKVENEAEETTSSVNFEFEPSVEEIVTDLIPNSLKTQLFKAVLDSNASEHGSRMTAMENATENAGELLKELKLTYNRARQANITKEILEIVGGAEALGK